MGNETIDRKFSRIEAHHIIDGLEMKLKKELETQKTTNNDLNDCFLEINNLITNPMDSGVITEEEEDDHAINEIESEARNEISSTNTQTESLHCLALLDYFDFGSKKIEVASMFHSRLKKKKRKKRTDTFITNFYDCVVEKNQTSCLLKM